MEPEKIYQRIGEFVVSFQWIENRFREIGWFILDPERKEWSPRALRSESTADLAEKVDELFAACIDSLGLENGEERRKAFRALVDRFHKVRLHRNAILHSAYIELKADGEIVDLLRSHPKRRRAPESGELQFDREFLAEESFSAEMKEMAQIAFELNMHYVQLIHRLSTNGGDGDA